MGSDSVCAVCQIDPLVIFHTYCNIESNEDHCAKKVVECKRETMLHNNLSQLVMIPLPPKKGLCCQVAKFDFARPFPIKICDILYCKKHEYYGIFRQCDISHVESL